MTTGTSRLVTAIIIILLILVGGFLYYSKYSALASISSFEECRAAGYQIMESYPEQCSTPDGRIFTNTTNVATSTSTTSPVGTTSTPIIYKDIVRVTNITQGQVVTSPLTIEGQARGPWYFEASFPVELVDATGKRLAIAPAQAQGEWMTTNFVPFSITLTFSKPTTATGTLILHKDNPSGLPEHGDELRIPVRFSQ